MSKNKTAIAIALFLMFAMTFSLVALPAANAHTPAWTIVSYAYISATPNPVGVGQPINIYMWVDHPLPSATEVPGQSNDVRRENYKLTITDPDGVVTTQTFTDVRDPTGFQGYQFIPSKEGTYSFKFDYPEQTYTWSGDYQNDTFTAASAGPINVTVQAEQISYGPGPALPTQYWTRPIEGQNYNWYTVASNWLSAPYVVTFGGHSGTIQTDGAAPTTGHIMWTKPIQFGGVVGGNDTNIPGEAYYQGGSYNTRFGNPIIMNDILYFQLPYGETGGGGNYVAWDLKTGKELWSINTTQPNGLNLVPSFGYLPSMDQPNQHGILPDGLLIAPYSVGGFYFPGFGFFGGTPCWAAYDPMTGVLTNMNITNIPSGSPVMGPGGQYLIIRLVNLAPRGAAPEYYLQEWNSTKVFGIYAGTGTSYWYTGTENADVASAYDWNISLPDLDALWSPGDVAWSIGGSGGVFGATAGMVVLNDYVVLMQGTFGGHVGGMMTSPQTYNANMTEVSLKPNSMGKLNWEQSYPQAPENMSRIISAWDPDTGVFIFWDQESMDHYGYSLSDGKQLWGPVYVPTSNNNDWMYTGDGTSQENCAYGNLYWTGYDGDLYCFNDTTGALKWTFGNGATPDNSTSAPLLPYGQTPMFIATIADGMIYTISSEHSPNSPLYPGYDLRCINATTGLQIWAMPDYGNLMYGGNAPIASGYLVVDNTYDQQIDSYGKGPSKLTVSAPDTVQPLTTQVLVQGTVTDISAGSQQEAVAANFPNGLPCVSDQSMSPWMEYVYMQQPKPANTTGVKVTVSVLDPNNNYYEVGTTTSDASGMFKLMFTPQVPGEYTVIASFAGSGSYYGSTAETALGVAEAPVASPPPTPTPAPMTDMYVLGIGTAAIIAIVVVGLVIILMLRRR
jgi:outer membrane protein assembly factor BamB